jgi:thiosulfate dehydrogenase
MDIERIWKTASRSTIASCGLALAVLAGCTSTSPPGSAGGGRSSGDPAAPETAAPAQKPETPAGTVLVAAPTGTSGTEMACDGGGGAKVSGDLRGTDRAGALLDQWRRDHPDQGWAMDEKEKHAIPPPADNAALVSDGQSKGHTYGSYTARDIAAWARETEKFVSEGSRIFHDAGLLGSTVAVSCDMCHPNAANTHPETYPKFQVQLGKGALLRDMINWCIENPVRGKPLAADDPKMRALEAYILAVRTGTKMEFGKH